MTDTDHGREQAAAQMQSIVELMHRMKEAENGGDMDEIDALTEEIQEDALEVQLRTGWYNPGNRADARAEEYLILLSTGGPATRIVGRLNEHSEPETAELQFQNWFTPWKTFPVQEDVAEDLLKYTTYFYYGE